MAVRILNASSQFLLDSTLVGVNFPITLGGWFKPTSFNAGNAELWSVKDTTEATTAIYIYLTGTSPRTVSMWSPGFGVLGIASVAADKWYYVVSRISSAAGTGSDTFYLAVLDQDGGITHGSQTNGAGFSTTIDKIYIGEASNSWDGDVAETWGAALDGQIGGGQMSDALVRQLAYRGPWSVPHIYQKLIFYKSFRSSLGYNEERPNEDMSGSFGRRTWTVSGPLSLTPHPPYCNRYIKPPRLKPFMAGYSQLGSSADILMGQGWM